MEHYATTAADRIPIRQKLVYGLGAFVSNLLAAASGAIAAGLSFALPWQLPEGRRESLYFWHFLIGSIVFYLACTVFATPWVALGYELTPDYHERTRLMGVQNFMGQLAYVVRDRPVDRHLRRHRAGHLAGHADRQEADVLLRHRRVDAGLTDRSSGGW